MTEEIPAVKYLLVGIDTGGGMSGLSLSRFYDLVADIPAEYVRLIQCDTAVRMDIRLPLPFDPPLTLFGGGGTDMRPLWNRIAADDDQPDCAVIFTDGAMPKESFGKDPGFPVYWVYPFKKNPPAPFGTTIVLVDVVRR